MKIVKINSLGCPSCIIMNKVFNQIKKEYDFELLELDYDFDDIDEYNAGNILPIFIFYKGEEEVERLCGEHKIEEFDNILRSIK